MQRAGRQRGERQPASTNSTKPRPVDQVAKWADGSNANCSRRCRIPNPRSSMSRLASDPRTTTTASPSPSSPPPKAEPPAAPMAKPKAASSSASPSPSAAASRRPGRACKARSLACRECRDRKIRCDGGRPVCDSCCRRGLSAGQCVYPEIEHEGSIASSRSYIRVLQKRVQELEAREQQLTLAARNHALSGSSPAQDDAWSRPFGSPGPVPLQPKPAQPAEHVIPPIQTTEMHAFPSGSGSISMVQEPSNYYAQHPAQMGTSPPLTDDLEDVSPIKSSFGSYSTNVKAALMLEKIALPPPELMDDLLGEYFDLDWITMPVVHRQSFIQRYHRLIAVANSRYRRDIPLAEATELATTFCLLLGMLAVGQLSKPGNGNPTTTEASAATEFHEQARALLFADLISAPSLPVVQALIIHARFLRRSGSFQESWVMTGLAHRLAEGLLLHLDLPVRSLAEREERRRTWCSCVLLIRMQSVAHGGRSTTTSPSFGILPAEVDDEQLENHPSNMERSQSPDVPSWISFFVQTLKLSDTVLQPIQQFYFDNQTQDNKDSVTDILNTTLRLDEQLQDWHNSLPRHLHIDLACSQGQMGQRRQALLLHMRYLETKALLSRATIMKLVQSHPDKPLASMPKSLLGGVIDACCTASTELMDLLSRERELTVLAGIPSSHIVISLSVAGMTLSMLLKMPVFSELIRNPTIYADDTRRCLSLSKQFYTCRHQMAEKYIQAFEASVQPQPRLAASPGLVDPALEAKTLPTLSGDRGEPTNNASEAGSMEMAMLDAWYLGRPELLASVGGFSISEIVSLW